MIQDDDEESRMPTSRKPTEPKLEITEKRNRELEKSESRDSRDIKARRDLALETTDVQRGGGEVQRFEHEETTSPHATLDERLDKRSKEITLGIRELNDKLERSIQRDEDEHERLRITIADSDSARQRDIAALNTKVEEIGKKQEYGNGRLDELLKRNAEDEELKRLALKSLINSGIADREADRKNKTADRAANRTRWNKTFAVIGSILMAAGIAAAALIKSCEHNPSPSPTPHAPRGSGG